MNTLDSTQQAYRDRPTPYFAQAYLNAVLEYWADEMIGDATLEAAKIELAAWAGKITDPRTGGAWGPA